MEDTAFKQARLKLYWQNVDHTNVGDAAGLVGSTGDGNAVFHLHTAWPGRSGDTSTNEAAYTGYSAQTRGRNATNFPQAGNEIGMAADVAFPKQTDTGTDIMLFWSAAFLAGAQPIAAMGTLGGGPPKSFTGADTGDLITSVAHGLVDTNRVALFQIEDDIAFPAGLTEGTVYYVISATTDTFQVSATEGGAAVTITADGYGRWQKCEPIQMGLNVKPVLEASGFRVVAS